jgi:hypothetical protein
LLVASSSLVLELIFAVVVTFLVLVRAGGFMQDCFPQHFIIFALLAFPENFDEYIAN